MQRATVADPIRRQTKNVFKEMRQSRKEQEEKKLTPLGLFFSLYWKYLFNFTVILLLLPLLFGVGPCAQNGSICRGAFAFFLTIACWLVESAPLPVSALLPLTLFPLFSIVSSHDNAIRYFNDSIMILFGGILLAIGFEYSELHKRIALKTIVTVGSSESKLLLGVVVVTGILSGWMSNTAVTAMMTPIVLAILEEFRFCFQKQILKENEALREQLRLQAGETNKTNSPGGGVGNQPKTDAKSDTKTVPQTPPEVKSDPEDTPQEELTKSGKKKKRKVEINPAQARDSGPGGKRFRSKVQPQDGSDKKVTSIDDIVLKRVSTSNFVVTEEPRVTKIPLEFLAKFSSEEQHRIEREMQLTHFLYRYKTMFLLATAYSANLGGTLLLTGSGTNVVAYDLINSATITEVDGENADISFGTWVAHNWLIGVVNLILMYVFLLCWFTDLVTQFCRKKDDDKEFVVTKAIIRDVDEAMMQAYSELGPITTHEIGVICVFVTTMIVWIFHDPKIFPGWVSLFPKTKPTLATPALVAITFYFLVPKDKEFYQALIKCQFKYVKFRALMTWEYVQNKLPWGINLVLGGGFALSNGFTQSGLGDTVGNLLQGLNSMSKETILLIILYITSFLTEGASNTAVASIFIPVLMKLSRKLAPKVHPLYFSFSSATASSYSFMLPIATPPNAIVYTAGKLQTKDMIKPGFFMNIMTAFVHWCLTITYGNLIFNYNDYEYKCKQVNDTVGVLPDGGTCEYEG